ncbi:glycoside hydrolase family 10 protein [Serendipita vermifera MAFF 305830]|uniref:Beta-xylanase n=1 Tax=Serendipita vermifera MAFF 305830 TaxID=933852 RepID=A0A0C3AV54_SERVB|nr:glycoside hydrolase family 10 protein [Serendipita vermifera MAFF 305830]
MKATILTLVLVSLASGVVAVPTDASALSSSSLAATCSGLVSCFKSKGKRYFGYFQSTATLPSQSTLQASFNQITPATSTLWDVVEPSQNAFNFAGGDTLVNFAQSNGFIIRGYTFIWHSQLPSWVSSITSAATLTSVIQNHITREGGRWKGKMYAWDVYGSFRNSVFYNILGQNFVSIAFAAAKSADSGAKLYINDYNLDVAGYAKTTAMISRVKSWKAANVPIDGIGSQSRLSAGGAGGCQGALTALASSGVSEVAMTELDIAGGSSSDWVTAVKACVMVPSCVGITIADTSDFFTGNTPKAAYTAVLNMLQAP